MKKILIIILTIISLVSYGQKIPCLKYTLYSDIWSHECGDNEIQRLLPKNHKGFSLDTEYIKNNIDERKVESYLLESLNEFRADYGVGPVKESKWLTKISEVYVKKLANSVFKHDNIGRYGIQMKENIAGYNMLYFSRVTANDGDLNKIIADSYFDRYVCSSAHMAMLLCDNDYFGFGFIIKGSEMFGVVRSSSKPKDK
jgi:uncharacterized protein YkwD